MQQLVEKVSQLVELAKLTPNIPIHKVDVVRDGYNLDLTLKFLDVDDEYDDDGMEIKYSLRGADSTIVVKTEYATQKGTQVTPLGKYPKTINAVDIFNETMKQFQQVMQKKGYSFKQADPKDTECAILIPSILKMFILAKTHETAYLHIDTGQMRLRGQDALLPVLHVYGGERETNAHIVSGKGSLGIMLDDDNSVIYPYTDALLVSLVKD